MNKIIITALLLCTGLVAVGCEKNYSVEEFKKDKKLMQEWGKKCEKMGPSAFETKNCQNAMQADMELFQEHYRDLAKKLRENSTNGNETEKQQNKN
ncbi:EexN family lipoprotein [Bartonella queenslandensis]|uniref:EexN family lipoprotein n=1 Tax=Bartonella queenslandensis TaxID=481138 RepID=UPI001BA94E69|nr:EexN family lipoprotein [Bartonella queenslandensis]